MKDETKYVIAGILAVIGSIMIVVGVSIMIVEHNQRESCLNLPPNEFFSEEMKEKCSGVIDYE